MIPLVNLYFHLILIYFLVKKLLLKIIIKAGQTKDRFLRLDHGLPAHNRLFLLRTDQCLVKQWPERLPGLMLPEFGHRRWIRRLSFCLFGLFGLCNHCLLFRHMRRQSTTKDKILCEREMFGFYFIHWKLVFFLFQKRNRFLCIVSRYMLFKVNLWETEVPFTYST